MSSVETQRQPNADGEPGEWLQCPCCDYRTDRPSNMKRHVKDMHEPLQQEIGCCDLFFTTKGLSPVVHHLLLLSKLSIFLLVLFSFFYP